jgi:hypothetical protein
VAFLFGQEGYQRNHSPHLPFLAARFAGALRFSGNAEARELAILKKSEDHSDSPRPVSALPCDARRLQGEVENVPIENDCGYCGARHAMKSPLLKGGACLGGRGFVFHLSLMEETRSEAYAVKPKTRRCVKPQ